MGGVAGVDSNDEAGDIGGDSHMGSLTGWRALEAVMLVDQSSLGRTPRSNPAVYIGAFDDIRKLYADSPEAKSRNLPAGAFSFNSAQGQCVVTAGEPVLRKSKCSS